MTYVVRYVFVGFAHGLVVIIVIMVSRQFRRRTLPSSHRIRRRLIQMPIYRVRVVESM